MGRARILVPGGQGIAGRWHLPACSGPPSGAFTAQNPWECHRVTHCSLGEGTTARRAWAWAGTRRWARDVDMVWGHGGRLGHESGLGTWRRTGMWRWVGTWRWSGTWRQGRPSTGANRLGYLQPWRRVLVLDRRTHGTHPRRQHHHVPAGPPVHRAGAGDAGGVPEPASSAGAGVPAVVLVDVAGDMQQL